MFQASAANNQGDSLQFCFTHQQQVFSNSWTQTNHHDQVVFELLWCVLCWVDLYVVSSSWPRQWGWRSENRLWLQPPFQEGWVDPPLPSWDAIKEMLFASQLPENQFINNRKCFTWKQTPWSRLDCDLLQLSELCLSVSAGEDSHHDSRWWNRSRDLRCCHEDLWSSKGKFDQTLEAKSGKWSHLSPLRVSGFLEQ